MVLGLCCTTASLPPDGWHCHHISLRVDYIESGAYINERIYFQVEQQQGIIYLLMHCWLIRMSLPHLVANWYVYNVNCFETHDLPQKLRSIRAVLSRCMSLSCEVWSTELISMHREHRLRTVSPTLHWQIPLQLAVTLAAFMFNQWFRYATGLLINLFFNGIVAAADSSESSRQMKSLFAHADYDDMINWGWCPFSLIFEVVLTVLSSYMFPFILGTRHNILS